MKRNILILLLMTGMYNGIAGDTLYLQKCWELGAEYYPLSKQDVLFDQALDARLATIALKSYFPRLTVRGEASYQSDVPWIGDALPAGTGFNIEKPSKDQYRAVIDIQQTLYDANRSRSAKAMERLNTQEEKQQNAVEMHALKQQIQRVYFTGLLQQCYNEILQLTLSTLNERIRIARSTTENGVTTQRDLRLLEVEKLKTEKQVSEAKNNQEACIKMLEELTGEKFMPDVILALPNVRPLGEEGLENRRIEMDIFDTRIEKTIANKDVLNAETLPQVNLFGNLGYGRPGYNMLSNKLEPLYLFGLRVSWVPWDGNAIKKEKKNMEIQAQILANRKAAFDDNVRASAWEKLYDIRKQENLLQQDLAIVDLRNKITGESASQLDNGTLTTSDYITDLNAETIARLNAESTKIQLIKARIDYQLELGIE